MPGVKVPHLNLRMYQDHAVPLAQALPHLRMCPLIHDRAVPKPAVPKPAAGVPGAAAVGPPNRGDLAMGVASSERTQRMDEEIGRALVCSSERL